MQCALALKVMKDLLGKKMDALAERGAQAPRAPPLNTPLTKPHNTMVNAFDNCAY